MSHFFIWKLGALINSVHDFDHKSLQKDIFEVIIRTSAALRPARVANSRELLDLTEIETEDSICFLHIGDNDCKIHRKHQTM